MGKYKTVIQKSGHDRLREVVVYEVSSCSDLTGNVLVLWVSGRLR